MIQCPVCKRYFGARFLPVHGPVGKRCSGGDKTLTPDDVAKKLETAALRVWRIMLDLRQAEGDLYEQVRDNRYLTTGVLQGLLAELLAWEINPTRSGTYAEDKVPTP